MDMAPRYNYDTDTFYFGSNYIAKAIGTTNRNDNKNGVVYDLIYILTNTSLGWWREAPLTTAALSHANKGEISQVTFNYCYKRNPRENFKIHTEEI